MTMDIERKVGASGEGVRLVSGVARLGGACVGCAGCRGLCAELIELLTLPDAVLRDSAA
ncbi:hypothetical protein GQ651_03075 [Alphaproteobacteria bacterium GH1-50]|uniref:Uncharacterized protein n=1 Tax=Kangsaoukella pontilimi TaxID=2691042 RepID=A0A7C9J1H9_9RHOB|nr:hypothetical protein [Kangsaoukella pontilimi]MXQ06821.1 hypothetical protein [Kangsaoukella pontilimi]